MTDASRFRPASIRARLLLLTVFSLLVAALLVFALVSYQQHRLLRTEWVQSLAAQARLVATNSRAAVAFRDPMEAHRLLAAVQQNPSILRARLYTGDGALFAAFARPDHERGSMSGGPEPEGHRFTHDAVIVWTTLRDHGNTLARVELIASLTALHDVFRRTLLETGAALLLLLASSMWLARGVVRRLSAPVEELNGLMARMAADTKLRDRATVQGADEIASLGRGLNHLMDTLQARESELTDYRDKLEQLVELRSRALHRAMEEAHHANQAKSDFLAHMSHEIRTPLNAIVGMSALLLQQERDPQRRDRLEKVVSAADALIRIVNEVLDFAKIESGRMGIEHVTFDLHKVVGDQIGVMEGRVRAKGLDLCLAIAPDVPRRLRGDPLRLGQILLNLLSNAVKFTDRGKVSLNVACVPGARSDSGRVRLRFEVRDTGFGIPADCQTALFTPFTQADGSITRRYGGTGLGLAICKQLVELMQGEIGLVSTPGEGSLFHFELSLEVDDDTGANASPPTVPSAPPLRSDFDPARLRGARVLLVDDVALNREVALGFLRDAGVRVDVAHDGREAVERVARECYDLVLMDIQMPVLDGLAATRAIRGTPRLRDLPIIAMTAHALPADRERSLLAGMNDHLNKPIDPRALLQTLARWIAPGSARCEGKPAPSSDGAVEQAADLPPLEGIDVATGLRNHLGRVALYRRMLDLFLADFPAVPERIAAAQARGEWAEARRLAHSCQSAAASIGALALARLAHEVEGAYAQGRAPEPGQTEALAVEMTRVTRALAVISAPMPPSDGASTNDDPIAARKACDRLTDLLRAHDARAEDALAALRKALPERAHDDDMECLRVLIEDVEHEAALDRLAALRERIDTPGMNG